MKKMLMIMLCVGLVPMLFAAGNTDIEATQTLSTQAPHQAMFRPYNSQSRDILWSQIPNPATSIGLACQLDSAYPFEADITDDVLPDGSGWAIDSVRSWWANWNGFTNWTYVPNIHFLVYADSGIATPFPVDSPSVEVVVEQANYTATSIGTDEYVVDMELPSQVQLNSGIIYWVEIQPSNVFTVNGQTGAMSEVGIGNGQDLYFRSVVLGVPDWVTATTQWGSPYESGFELIGGPLVQTVTWDFETGWQGWTHTSALTFPAAWDVQPSGIHSAWTPPSADDSSMWVDSDAAGSSGPWIQDTALSPILIPLAATDWCVYGTGYHYISSGEFFEVGVKYFDGSTWTVVPLKTYTADFGPAWDSIDVSPYNGYQWIQLYFYYDDGDNWAWYAAFDNVTIDAIIYVPGHDIATTAIVAPVTQIPPSVPITCEALYENQGSEPETFDAYFVIDSSGVNIYSDMVSGIAIAAGEDTSIQFSSWTPGSSDQIIYDVTAYCVCPGDQDPSNDTLSQQTLISLVSNWIDCANMPAPALGNATSYDPVNDHVYSFGGADGYSAYYNYAFQYDPVGDAWTAMATMPNAVNWIDASYANGRFYIFGGYTGGVNNFNQQYDVSGNSWSTGTAMPSGRIAGGQVVYNDSIIYYLGGYNGSGPTADVQLYDTYLDTWATGTSLPQLFQMGGVAMTGDTIWLVGGYNGSAYFANLYYGVINPSDVTDITWNTGSAMPVTNMNNGATQLDRDGAWYLYMVGGFADGSASHGAWEYNVGSDSWVQLPDYGWVIVRNDFLIGREGQREIYVCGGDNSGGWTMCDEVWKLHWAGGVAENPGTQDRPFTMGFSSNMQNPVKERSTIVYSIGKAGHVSLKVYDRTGRLVQTLVNDDQLAGTKTVNWDTKTIASGVYFLKLEVDGNLATHKLIVVK